MYAELELSTDLRIGVHYTLIDDSPSNDIDLLSFSKELDEIDEIKLVEGELVDLVYHIANENNFWDWLEAKLLEIND